MCVISGEQVKPKKGESASNKYLHQNRPESTSKVRIIQGRVSEVKHGTVKGKLNISEAFHVYQNQASNEHSVIRRLEGEWRGDATSTGSAFPARAMRRYGAETLVGQSNSSGAFQNPLGSLKLAAPPHSAASLLGVLCTGVRQL